MPIANAVRRYIPLGSRFRRHLRAIWPRSLLADLPEFFPGFERSSSMLQPWPTMLGDILAQSYFLRVHGIRQRDACILPWCLLPWCLPAWVKLSYEPPLSVYIIDNSPACAVIASLKTVATGIISLILFDLPAQDRAKDFRRNAR